MTASGMIAVDKMGGKVLFLDPQSYETQLVIDGFPRTVLPTAYTLTVHELAKQFQARDVTAYFARGGQRQSHWRVLGIGVLCLVVVSVLVVGISLLLPAAAA